MSSANVLQLRRNWLEGENHEKSSENILFSKSTEYTIIIASNNV
jgi:hypothetical protein